MDRRILLTQKPFPSGKSHGWTSPPPARGAIARRTRKTVMRTSFRAALQGRLASPRYATGVRRMPTALENIIPHVAQAGSHGGIPPCLSETSRSPLDSARNLERRRRVVEQVARQLQPMPVSSQTPAPRPSPCWALERRKSRPASAIRAPWPSPAAAHTVLQHVETGDDVERFRGERRIQDISHKHLGSGLCLGSSRTVGRHLDSIELPGFALEKLQKRSRAAAQVEERTGLLVLP